MRREHLPAVGVGPLVVFPQILITAIGIGLDRKGYFSIGKIAFLKIPFLIIGILLIIAGIMLWYCANYRDKVFDCINENKLLTSGVYSAVRNPIYSAFLLACTGAVLIENNLFLFTVPIICWAYMTVLLINSEEKWLLNLYGDEYKEYCKKVNRCIPFFTKKR